MFYKRLHESRVSSCWRGAIYMSLEVLYTFIVESVGDLVADDDADAAVVQRLREVLVVERRLQDSRGEHFRGNNNS